MLFHSDEEPQEQGSTTRSECLLRRKTQHEKASEERTFQEYRGAADCARVLASGPGGSVSGSVECALKVSEGSTRGSSSAC